MYYPPQTQVTQLTTITRQRYLPVPGQVLVRVGDRVEPTTPVARSLLPGEYRILDLVGALGVRETEVDKYLVKKIGQQVQKGERIAVRRGLLFPRVCRAPTDGFIAATGVGRVLLETVSPPYEVPAYIRGQVVSLRPNYGVAIETVGALIEGVWGAGGEGTGVIKVLTKRTDEPLSADKLTSEFGGAVIVGGLTADQTALKQAVNIGARGMVLGSLDVGLRELATDLPFPLIVTEGMGRIPMAAPIFDLLKEFDGSKASLSGKTSTQRETTRPEIIIPQLGESALSRRERRPLPLDVGLTVRIISQPYQGAVGVITDLPYRPQEVDSGARLKVARVDLGDEGVASVPLANLELLRT
jgi:hypothetical protein